MFPAEFAAVALVSYLVYRVAPLGIHVYVLKLTFDVFHGLARIVGSEVPSLKGIARLVRSRKFDSIVEYGYVILRFRFKFPAVHPVVYIILMDYKRRPVLLAPLHQRGEIYFVSVVILPVKEIPAFADGRFRRIWHSFIDGDNFPVHIDLDKIVVGRLLAGQFLAGRVVIGRVVVGRVVVGRLLAGRVVVGRVVVGRVVVGRVAVGHVVVGRVVVGRVVVGRVDNARRRIGHRGQIARQKHRLQYYCHNGHKQRYRQNYHKSSVFAVPFYSYCRRPRLILHAEIEF